MGPIISIRESVEAPWRGGGMLSGGAQAMSAEEIGIELGQLDVVASVTIAFAIERWSEGGANRWTTNR